MNPEDRIEDLERQVEDLTRLVERMAGGDDVEPGELPESVREHVVSRAEPVAEEHRFADELRRNVDMMLHVDGDDLETQIGSVWLSRAAVVLSATAVVLGARVTLYSDFLGPLEKVGLVGLISLVAVLAGLLTWKRRNVFVDTVLGAGLAGLYYAAYAAWFVDGMRVFEGRAATLPVLGLVFVTVMVVAHRRRSETTAGIALFLVYYTVVASCLGGHSGDNTAYALLTGAALAVAVVVFHASQRWLLLTWAAFIATFSTYLYFFFRRPSGLNMTDVEYFWLSNGFLTLIYLAFSLSCVIDARKTGEYRRTVAPLAALNSILYFTLASIALHHQFPDSQWSFRLGGAAALLLFAALAETSGPTRNYLFQIYVAKAVVLFTLALQSLLAGDKMVVAMAVESLLLAVAYSRSGVVLFKALGMILLAVAFAGSLATVKAAGQTALGGYMLQSNWFGSLGAASVFMLTSWYYEKFVRRIRPEERSKSGHWFLADTVLDVRSGSAAILYAAAAAFILLTITIMDVGDEPALPYLLAGESVLMVLIGFVLRTAQVEVGGVLLLVAAHVCFHAFLYMHIDEFTQQSHYVPFTLAVAFCTYLGAHLWERYLRRARGGRPWEHHAVASLPYLVATVMITTLISQFFEGLDIALVQNALGLTLLMVGAATRFPGVKVSGLLALGAGTATCCMGLYGARVQFMETPGFVGFFALMLATYALAERLFVLFRRRGLTPSRLEDLVRSLLVASGTGLGAYGLHAYAEPRQVTLYWLILASAVLVIGAILRERRYRWAAIVLFGAGIIRAFAYDLRHEPLQAFLTFAGAAIVLLAVTWGYSHYRPGRVPRPGLSDGKDVPPHG